MKGYHSSLCFLLSFLIWANALSIPNDFNQISKRGLSVGEPSQGSSVNAHGRFFSDQDLDDIKIVWTIGREKKKDWKIDAEAKKKIQKKKQKKMQERAAQWNLGYQAE